MPRETLAPLDVLDVGLRGETLGFRMYDRLAWAVRVAPIHEWLVRLKLDEQAHLKTLRAHRRHIFGRTPVRVTDTEAETLLGFRAPPPVRDAATLVQALYGAIRFEERAAEFYAAHAHGLPWQETRSLVEMLARQSRPQASVLGRQIDLVRHRKLVLNRRGMLVEVRDGATDPTSSARITSGSDSPPTREPAMRVPKHRTLSRARECPPR